MTLLLFLASCAGPSKPPALDDGPESPVDAPGYNRSPHRGASARVPGDATP